MAASPPNSVYYGQSFPGINQPYAGASQDFNPTNSPQMRHAQWPSSYYDPAMVAPLPPPNQHVDATPNAYGRVDPQQQLYDSLPAAVPRSPNLTPGRGPYQVNTLSTITESSVGQYASTPRPVSEFGYQGLSEGSDRMSSVGSGSRPTSAYQPPQHYGGHKEKELVPGKSQESSPRSGDSETKEPPAYIP
jgi:hypothetical protein